jgi:hypothetical protein
MSSFSSSCTCRFTSEECCNATAHHCVCKYDDKFCQRNRKACQKRTREKKIYFELKKNGKDFCICEKYIHNEMLQIQCTAFEHTVCLCPLIYNDAKYIGKKMIQCKKSDEEHICICEILSETNSVDECRSIRHNCICYFSSGYKYTICRSEPEDHICICIHYNSSSQICRRISDHKCSCRSTTTPCLSIDYHECACIFHYLRENGKECQSTKGHQCICSFKLTYKSSTVQLNADYFNICKATTNHLTICICSLGLFYMTICPCKEFHSCQCKNWNRCRQHHTFVIWNEWDTNTDSYFYWFPEEVLKDIIQFLV